jgi:hypothetical protein
MLPRIDRSVHSTRLKKAGVLTIVEEYIERRRETIMEYAQMRNI